MALSTCADCSTAYAVGLAACPHCGSTDRREGARSVLPWLDVSCSADGCRTAGVVRRVHQRQAAPGVLEAPLYACATCGAPMLTVASWHASAALDDLEFSMPKITRHGGPTNAADEQPASAPATEQTAPAEPAAGEEESSPGSSSETSSPKPEKSSAPSAADRQRPARTTGSRSKRARGESSTARTTDGSGEAERP